MQRDSPGSFSRGRGPMGPPGFNRGMPSRGMTPSMGRGVQSFGPQSMAPPSMGAPMASFGMGGQMGFPMNAQVKQQSNCCCITTTIFLILAIAAGAAAYWWFFIKEKDTPGPHNDETKNNILIDVMRITNGTRVPLADVRTSIMNNNTVVSSCITNSTGFCEYKEFTQDFVRPAADAFVRTKLEQGTGNPLTFSDLLTVLNSSVDIQYANRPDHEDQAQMFTALIADGGISTPNVEMKVQAAAVGKDALLVVEKCADKQVIFSGTVAADRVITATIPVNDYNNSGFVRFPTSCRLTLTVDGDVTTCSSVPIYAATTEFEVTTQTCSTEERPQPPVIPSGVYGIYWGTAGSESYGEQEFIELFKQNVRFLMLTIYGTTGSANPQVLRNMIGWAKNAGIAASNYVAFGNSRFRSDPLTAAREHAQGVIDAAVALKDTNMTASSIIWLLAFAQICSGSNYCETWYGMTTARPEDDGSNFTAADRQKNCQYIQEFARYVDENYTDGPDKGYRVGIVIGYRASFIFGNCPLGDVTKNFVFHYSLANPATKFSVADCPANCETLKTDIPSDARFYARDVGYKIARDVVPALPDQPPYNDANARTNMFRNYADEITE